MLAPDLDKAAEYAVRWPITAGFFAILLAIAYSTRWVATVGWPKWQEAQKERAALMSAEAERTRAHLSAVLAQRGTEAESAVRSVQELEAVKQRAIVDGIGSKVDVVSGQVKEVDSKVSLLHEAFKALTKTPILALLVFVLATASYAVVWAVLTGRECTKDSDCVRPAYCCSGGTCCRNTAHKDSPAVPVVQVSSPFSGESYRDYQAEFSASPPWADKI